MKNGTGGRVGESRRRRKSTGVVGSNRHMSLLTRIGHFSYTVARADYFGQPLIPPTCQSYRVYPAGCFRLTSGDDSNSDFVCFGPGFVSPIQALASPLLRFFVPFLFFFFLPLPLLSLLILVLPGWIRSSWRTASSPPSSLRSFPS